MLATALPFVPAEDRAARRPILRRIADRFRAHRMQAQLALIDPRLREDAGLTTGGEASWPRQPREQYPV